MAKAQGDFELDPGILEGSLDCVHCGLCLSACPTYRVTGRENSSPRGRVYLMRGAAEGAIEFGDLLTAELGLCLGCRACESECPSGVAYGAMLEKGRNFIAEAGLRKGLGPRLEGFALRHVLVHPRRLHALVSALRLFQRTGLDRLGALLLPSLSGAKSLLPEIPVSASRRPLPRFTPAQGKRRGRVALLEGCVMREIFGEVNRATVRVLARNGYEVWVPPGQGCCGALHAHAGDMQSARRLAEQNIDAFMAGGGEPVDAVVSNSAGCGAALREVAHWLPGTGERFSAGVRDVCEFLDEVGLRPPTNPLPARVCYDDPCHLVHAQGIDAAPRRVLESVPDLELVEHADSKSCCGGAGLYNLLQPDMSRQVLAPKLDALEAADPDYIATGNPGCMMQIGSGVEDRRMRAKVIHPVELLDRAYQVSEGPDRSCENA